MSSTWVTLTKYSTVTSSRPPRSQSSRFFKKWIDYSRGFAFFSFSLFVISCHTWEFHSYGGVNTTGEELQFLTFAWHLGITGSLASHTYSVICSSPILRTQCSVQWSSLSVIPRRFSILERNGCCKILTMHRLDKSLALRLYRVIYDSHAGNLQTCALVWSVPTHSRKDEVHVHSHCAVTSSYTWHSSGPSQNY